MFVREKSTGIIYEIKEKLAEGYLVKWENIWEIGELRLITDKYLYDWEVEVSFPNGDWGEEII